MKETRSALQQQAEIARDETSDRNEAGIRTLSELELALAGGGDDVVTWP